VSLLVGLSLLLGAVCAYSETPRAPGAPSYATQAGVELRENILPFWMAHAPDLDRGGFYGGLKPDLSPDTSEKRGALLATRILWTFSAAYRTYHDPAYLQMAQRAFADLQTHFWDKENGGLYWAISAAGKTLEPKKIVYVQSFGIYALSEYFRATDDHAALDRAIELYRLLEKHAHDRQNLGYFEEFTRDWKISRARGRSSPMGSLDQKSQNVHLHLLEAYTNLVRVWPDAAARENLRELYEVMFTKILDGSTHHLRLFLAENWEPRSNTISFGHDIEFSWLAVEAAELLGDEKRLAATRAEAVKIAEATLKEGVDPDGGILGEADPSGLTVTFKEWWPQAEATVGFLNAYQISGDRRFLDASIHTWDFIEKNLVDHERGEWFHGVSRDGKNVSSLKMGFWKCPYHSGRACMELVERLGKMNGASE
jgi:mannobiose 2-epimerase